MTSEKWAEIVRRVKHKVDERTHGRTIFPWEICTPDIVSSNIEALIDDAISVAIGNKEKDMATIKKLVAARNGDNPSYPEKLIRKSYKEMFDAYSELTDEYKQIKRADHGEKQRFLFYRALTTLIVGIVFMLLAWAAHNCAGMDFVFLHPTPEKSATTEGCEISGVDGQKYMLVPVNETKQETSSGPYKMPKELDGFSEGIFKMPAQ